MKPSRAWIWRLATGTQTRTTSRASGTVSSHLRGKARSEDASRRCCNDSQWVPISHHTPISEKTTTRPCIHKACTLADAKTIRNVAKALQDRCESS